MLLKVLYIIFIKFLAALPFWQVDIPLDPHLFELISSSGVEVDLLQKRQIHYFLKVVIALVPGILILWLIRESAMLLHVTSKRFLYKKYNQLFDMAYAENFILVNFQFSFHFLPAVKYFIYFNCACILNLSSQLGMLVKPNPCIKKWFWVVMFGIFLMS